MKKVRTSKRWNDRDAKDIEKADELQRAGISSRGLPPSKKYKVNPLYSREPKAICENVRNLGLPPCQFGEGIYCYSRRVCSSQLDINNPENHTPEAKEILKRESDAAIQHAREISAKMSDEDSMSDAEYEEMIKRIMGG